jgi:paraquat-inducible protein A
MDKIVLLIACHECDLVHRLGALTENTAARCTRCGATLVQRKPDTLRRCLAFAIAGLILFLIANIFPFLAFKVEFQMRQTTLITGILELYRQGYPQVAAVVLATTIVAPAVQLISVLFLVVPLMRGYMPRWVPHTLRLVKMAQPWSMMEIFMIGILVALVKLSKMARIEPGIAIFSFFGLICVMAALTAALDTHWIWEKWSSQRLKTS